MPNLLWFEWEKDVDGYRFEELKPGEAPEYEYEPERELGTPPRSSIHERKEKGQ